MSRAVWTGVCVVSLLASGWTAVVRGGESPAALETRIQDLRDEVSGLQDRIAELEAAAEKSRQVDAALEEMGAEALPNDFRLYWDDGVRARTTDDRIDMEFSGRLMYDWTWIEDNDFEDRGLNLRDAGEVRQARLYWQGTFWKKVRFKWEFDWADGDADVRDLYLELRDLPADTGAWHFRGGHFKEPFSLQQITNSLHTTFMERALPDVFVPGRNPGFMLHGTVLEERVTAAAGIFKAAEADVDCEAVLVDVDGDGAITPADSIACDVELDLDEGGFRRDGDYVGTVRLTALPWYDPGKGLFHIGGSYRFQNTDAVYAARPEAHRVDPLIATTLIPVDEVHQFGAEAAFAVGPFHGQGEYIWVNHDLTPGTPETIGDPTFFGWYAQAGVFLTGEGRPYTTQAGTWARVKPKRNYGEDGGFGAVEVAGRYSVLDLDERDFRFGEMRNWTVALNWYLTPNVIVRWNYVYTMLEDVEEVDGEDSPRTDLIMMRLQVDF